MAELPECGHEWVSGADYGKNAVTMLPDIRFVVWCEKCGIEKGER